MPSVGFVDGPSGKDFGDFGDVALRVAAVDAEGVQFQQLAAVVFVQAACSVCALRSDSAADSGG